MADLDLTADRCKVIVEAARNRGGSRRGGSRRFDPCDDARCPENREPDPMLSAVSVSDTIVSATPGAR